MSLAEQLDALTPEQRQNLMQKLAQKQQASREEKRSGTELPISKLDVAGAVRPIVRQSRTMSEYPLSKAQERIWFLESLEGAKPTYHIAAALAFEKSLDLAALEYAMAALINRHQALRSRFVETFEGVRQRFLSSDSVSPQLVRKPVNDKELSVVLNAAVNQPFDLSSEPPFRIHWYQADSGKSHLLLVMHHIISDAWTAGLLLTELSTLYNAKINQSLPKLAPLNCEFTDYVFWQNQLIESDEIEKQIDWWEDQLRDVNDLELPLNRPREKGAMSKGSFHRAVLPKATMDAFNLLCKSQHVSVFHGLMAVFQTLLYRVTQQSDFAIGTPFAGREHSDSQSLVGLFVNTLPIMNDAKAGLTFHSLLASVRSRILQAHQQQNVPFEVLVDRLNVARDTLSSPLFQVFFSYQAENPLNQIAFGENVAEFMPVHTETAKFDLSLMVQSENNDLVAHFEYNAQLFDEATIAGLQDSFFCLLDAVCHAPNTHIDQLALVSTQAKSALFANFGPKTSLPELLDVAALIEQQAVMQPESIAVQQGENRISFGELNQKANGLAKQLNALGVGSGARVGLHLPPSIELMAGMLATIKLGAAYVPMDIQLPDVRLHFISEHAELAIVLSMDETTFTDQSIVLNLRDIESEPENPIRELTAQTPIYTLYTSGSTGKPKAASVSLASEVNLLNWYGSTYGLDSSQHVLVFSAIGFDLTQKNLLGSLCFGAQCHFPETPYYDPEAIVNTIEAQKITWVNCAPSALYPLIDFCVDFNQLASLQQVFLGGESIQVDRLTLWLKHSKAQLINMYGPTECADITTSYTLDADTGLGENKLPIGRAIDHVQTYVLDANQQLLPQGAIGELCIAGRSVGLGYFKNKSLNEKTFIANPFSQHSDDKILYRTGDLVRYNGQGLLEFVARNDGQMKIRGIRVDPEEIESALKAIDGVSDAVVNLQGAAHDQLVAFIKSENGLVDTTAYQHQLSQRLAKFMIPVAFDLIDKIPLSPNGKVDRKQLPEIVLQRKQDIPFVGPRNPIEAELVVIWQSLLGVERISVHDDFFHLGGHSLLATQLMIRIREAFAMDLPLRTVFEVSSLEGLAEIIFSLSSHDTDMVLEEGVL